MWAAIIKISNANEARLSCERGLTESVTSTPPRASDFFVYVREEPGSQEL